MLILTACDNNASAIEERGGYWKNELERIVPIGTSKEHAIKLLQAVDPNAAVNLLSGNIYSILETIESNGLPCKNYVVTGTTKLTNSLVSGHAIALVGRCL